MEYQDNRPSIPEVVELFNALGHQVVLFYEVKESYSASKRHLIVLTRYVEDYSPYIENNQVCLPENLELTSDTKAEFLIHRSFVQRWKNGSLRLKKTTYFNLDDLQLVDGKDDIVSSDLESQEFKLVFKEKSAHNQRRTLNSFFDVQLEKSCFLFCLLEIGLRSLLKMPKLINVDREDLRRLNQRHNFISLCLLNVSHDFIEKRATEVSMNNEPLNQTSTDNRVEEEAKSSADQTTSSALLALKKLAAGRRAEDMQLDELLYEENLYDLKFSEMLAEVPELILGEEKSLLKNVAKMESEAAKIALEDKIGNTFEDVSSGFSQLNSCLEDACSIMKSTSSSRNAISDANERNRLWLGNLSALENELQHLIDRWSIGPKAEETINQMNIILNELLIDIESEMSPEREEKVSEIVDSIQEAHAELERAILGNNAVLTEEPGSIAKTKKTREFMQNHMKSVDEIKQNLDILKLKLGTNVHFFLLQAINNCTATGFDEAQSLTLEKLCGMKISSLVKPVIHSKLLPFANLVHVLSNAEFEEVKACYLEEMSGFYFILIKKVLSLFSESGSMMAFDEFKLSLRHSECSFLPLSAETEEKITHLKFSNEEAINHLDELNSFKGGGLTLNKAFELIVKMLMDIIDAERIFISAFFFTSEIATSLNLKPSLRFGAETSGKSMFRGKNAKRKVKFGLEEDEDNKINEQTQQVESSNSGGKLQQKREEMLFMESDAFLYDLLLKKMDIVREIDERILSKIKSSGTFYETLFISKFVAKETEALEKDRSSRRHQELVGKEFASFFLSVVQDLSKLSVDSLFQTEAKYLKSSTKLQIGESSALEITEKVPNFLQRSFLVFKDHSEISSSVEEGTLDFLQLLCEWLEKESHHPRKFVSHSSEDLNMSRFNLFASRRKIPRELFLIDNYYFLFHALPKFLETSDDSFFPSDSFSRKIEEFRHQLLIKYEDLLKQYATRLLLAQFDFLFTFVASVNKILSNFLGSVSQFKDLSYHKPFEEFLAVLRRLTATELDLDIVHDFSGKAQTSRGCFIPGRKSKKGTDLVTSLRKVNKTLNKDIPDEEDGSSPESKDTIKEKMVESLVQNYSVFCDIGSKCYNEDVKMSPDAFEALVRRHLQTQI